jgi:hypothetical protein
MTEDPWTQIYLPQNCLELETELSRLLHGRD